MTTWGQQRVRNELLKQKTACSSNIDHTMAAVYQEKKNQGTLMFYE